MSVISRSSSARSTRSACGRPARGTAPTRFIRGRPALALAPATRVVTHWALQPAASARAALVLTGGSRLLPCPVPPLRPCRRPRPAGGPLTGLPVRDIVGAVQHLLLTVQGQKGQVQTAVSAPPPASPPACSRLVMLCLAHANCATCALQMTQVNTQLRAPSSGGHGPQAPPLRACRSRARAPAAPPLPRGCGPRPT